MTGEKKSAYRNAWEIVAQLAREKLALEDAIEGKEDTLEQIIDQLDDLLPPGEVVRMISPDRLRRIGRAREILQTIIDVEPTVTGDEHRAALAWATVAVAAHLKGYRA